MKIDIQGINYLNSRGLSLETAVKMGVTSENGFISFPYVFNGKLARYKSRSITDKKNMFMTTINPDVKDDFKMPFWNAQVWDSSDYIIITEGEFDAMALTQLGCQKVVSLPNGASSVVSSFKNNYAYLQQFELIYICFDMDEAGNKAAEEAKKIIPSSKYRRIILPAKDANEWLKDNDNPQNINPLTVVDLVNLMRNSEKIHCEEIVPFTELSKDFYLERELGNSTGWGSLDNLIGGIRPGEVTVISADTGSGKTTFCINLLVNLMNNTGEGFWINSWEMDHQVIVRKVASCVLKKKFKTEAFTQEDMKIFNLWMKKNNCFINPTRSKADIKTLRNQIEMASHVYGVKYVLLDHLDYITATSSAKENHEKIAETVVAIHDIALEFGVHIILVAHPKQVEGKINMSHLRGSAAIKQYADNIILLHNKAQDDLSKPDNRVIVSIPKNRFLGIRGEVTLRYMREMDGYLENNEIAKQIKQRIQEISEECEI